MSFYSITIFEIHWSLLKVSYFIKKRGRHENQSDGTRHKQKESTVYNRAWNQLFAKVQCPMHVVKPRLSFCVLGCLGHLCIAFYARYILRIDQGSTGDQYRPQRLPVRKPRSRLCIIAEFNYLRAAITRGRKGLSSRGHLLKHTYIHATSRTQPPTHSRLRSVTLY